MSQTKIEWTDTTWNPTTGCTKISAGCKNCYAEKMSFRLRGMGNPKYANGFDLTLHENTLMQPYHWKKSKMVFVNSMSDLFHRDVPLEYIQKVFKTMNENQQHIFQVLTKRADLLFEYNNYLNWSDNIWMGVSVENEGSTDRINFLRMTDSKVKFISFEPLLGPLPNLNLDGINWVIVGGESGSGARIIKLNWVEEILAQCRENNVPFFFKQWGGVNKKINGRELNGQIYEEMPILLEN